MYCNQGSGAVKLGSQIIIKIHSGRDKEEWANGERRCGCVLQGGVLARDPKSQL